MLKFLRIGKDLISSSSSSPETITRMEVSSWQEAHGHLGDPSWPLPRLVTECATANRADQGNTTRADEFLDEPEVLNAKIDLIVELLQRSRYTVAYTGAGLSKSSGIPDYATRATNSIVGSAPSLKSPLDAAPTYAHHILAALQRHNLLHYYVQQNHDGLPQKAGYPQHLINEIHGAWHDPSNPVVQFSGNLRSDLFSDMLEAEQRTDLCLCLGTSLSGMNADRMAKTPAKRSLKRTPTALGTVLINIQRTSLDSKSSVRVWATLDSAFQLLAEKLQISMDEIQQNRVAAPQYDADVFELPYNSAGERSDSGETITLDLQIGARVRIVEPDAMNVGAIGIVHAKRPDGHWSIHFKEMHNDEERVCRRLLGWWWIESAKLGTVRHLPIVNVNDDEVDD